MARPQKEGIEYFPLDVDMDQDDKVYFIEAKYGITGFAVVVKLLMRIYKNGYYYLFTNKESIIFSKQTSADIDLINNVVHDCIDENFFNKNLYENYKILTSNGIQKRFFEICSRRKKITVLKEYLLINPNNYNNLVIVNINSINVDINSINADIGTQSKVKESKVKESKVSTTTNKSQIIENSDRLPGASEEPHAVEEIANYYFEKTGRFANSEDFVIITEVLDRPIAVPTDYKSRLSIIKQAMDRMTASHVSRNGEFNNRIKAFKFYKDGILDEFREFEIRSKSEIIPASRTIFRPNVDDEEYRLFLKKNYSEGSQ